MLFCWERDYSDRLGWFATGVQLRSVEGSRRDMIHCTGYLDKSYRRDDMVRSGAVGPQSTPRYY